MLHKGRSKGFTLVELMIVVVIVAILATVAVVAYTRHLRKSRMVKEKVFVSAIQALQESYFQQHGVYCNVTDGSPYPSSVPRGDAVAFNPGNTSNWATLGARPESGQTYFSWDVVASTSPSHTLTGKASSLGLTAGSSWYYIYGKGDLDGDASDYTEIFATSLKSEIWTQNEGQ